MAKRANLFQKIIYSINSAQHGVDATHSSLFLTDTVTGDDREVDVVVRKARRGRFKTIGIECIAHARKASVTWVEQMLGKHRDLKTNHLILVSRSGFAKKR
jgi:predicted Mrr-cat superfamily restriction endonuclease